MLAELLSGGQLHGRLGAAVADLGRRVGKREGGSHAAGERRERRKLEEVVLDLSGGIDRDGLLLQYPDARSDWSRIATIVLVDGRIRL